MKKMTLVAFGLTASLGAYAAIPTGTAPFQVVVPNLKSGLEITLEGLYLQASNSDMDYASNTVSSSSGPSLPFTPTGVSSINPSYNFGFRAALGFVFPNSGNDIQAAWTHLTNFNNNNTSVAFGPNVTTWTTRGGQVLNMDPMNPTLRNAESFSASGNENFAYNAIDLDIGQYLSIGTRLTSRIFAGLRFAEVKSNLSDNYAYINDITAIREIFSSSYNENLNSKFKGIGPRAGIDTTYNITHCFGVVGHFAAALLIGQVDTSLQATEASATNFRGAITSSSSSINVNSTNSRRIVPAFDAKVGFDYSIPFNNDAQHLTVEAGWQATHYYDAVDRLTQQGARTTSGVGLQGPYLSLNLKM